MTMLTASRRTLSRRASIRAALARLHAVWRQRQALNALDADALRDIGLSAAEAEAEARRRIWDAPDTWRA